MGGEPGDEARLALIIPYPTANAPIIASLTKFHSRSRLLEINGIDVSSKPHREVGSFLQSYREPVKLVVSRPLSPEALEAANFPDPYGIGSPSGMVIERFKKLNASLSAQLDSQSAEVERWRQESERY